MKKSITIVAVLLMAFVQTAMSQRKLASFPQMKAANPESVIHTQGLSTSSALLLADLMYSKLSEGEFVEKYGLVYSDGQPTVSAFVEGGEKELANYGARVVSKNGTILRVNIPLDQFVALAQSGICSRIDVGVKGHPVLDAARAEMGIDNIYNGIDLPHGYDGDGVVVGIIDVGFEYGHPAFYDSTGTLHRVKRVWNQVATSGTAPAGFGYGCEYTTTDEMLAAYCSHLDESHGSHVAGIAAGCGGNTDSTRRFRGMAPGADIVMVATTMQAPNVFDGINYIYNYAQSVGKPCVINMSLGSQFGPHDGTSSFDRSLEAFIAAHPQGVVVVGAAGNDGDTPLHISNQHQGEDTVLYTFVDFNDAVNYIDLWGSPNTPFKVMLSLYDTATNSFVEFSSLYFSNVEGMTMDTLMDGQFIIQAASTTGSINQRDNITLYMYHAQYQNSPYLVCMSVRSNNNAPFHGWVGRGRFFNYGYPQLQDGDSENTVAEIGGTGNSVVTVGAYNTRTHWTNITGGTVGIDTITLGGISFFSAHGPRIDGRTKPDITAPGMFIISSINSFDESYVGSYNCVTSTQFNGHTYYYGNMQGTSMATPMVTGIVALWLQAHPNYGFDSVVTLLRSTARTDSITGIIPSTGSNTWGWGKVNPFAGLNNAGDTTAIENTDVIDFKVFVEGRRIFIAAPQGQPVRIVDVMGRTVVDQKEVSPAGYTMPATGVYMVCIANAPARKVVVAQ